MTHERSASIPAMIGATPLSAAWNRAVIRTLPPVPTKIHVSRIEYEKMLTTIGHTRQVAVPLARQEQEHVDEGPRNGEDERGGER